jgi:hypothetical protein
MKQILQKSALWQNGVVLNGEKKYARKNKAPPKTVLFHCELE